MLIDGIQHSCTGIPQVLMLGPLGVAHEYRFSTRCLFCWCCCQSNSRTFLRISIQILKLNAVLDRCEYSASSWLNRSQCWEIIKSFLSGIPSWRYNSTFFTPPLLLYLLSSILSCLPKHRLLFLTIINFSQSRRIRCCNQSKSFWFSAGHSYVCLLAFKPSGRELFPVRVRWKLNGIDI